MLLPDTLLQNRYRVVVQLGQGGMGTVYEAQDSRLHTTVALKETHFSDGRFVRQFEREARLLAALRHPALPRVIDYFDERNGLYLVMDYVEGADFLERLQRRGTAFPLDEVLVWADQLLDALQYLHTQDPPVIHRDIKLQNLKLTGHNRIILLDFGLAKGLAVTNVLTTRTVLGYSLPYAPPEQILQIDENQREQLSVTHPDEVERLRRKGTDHRSDLYSAGATLLHLLTNRVPVSSPIRAISVWSGRQDPLSVVLTQSLPETVGKVLARALALEPEHRFASALEMRNALKGAGSGTAAETSSTLPPTITDSVDDVPRESSSPSETTLVRENAKTPVIWRVPAERPVLDKREHLDRKGAVAQVDDPVVAININQQYPYVRDADDLYNCTRSMWRIDRARASRARYAFSVYLGVIKEVYRIDRWLPATDETIKYWQERNKAQGKYFPPEVDHGRSEFVGELAPDSIRKKYVGKQLTKRHSQNSILYFNC